MRLEFFPSCFFKGLQNYDKKRGFCTIKRQIFDALKLGRSVRLRLFHCIIATNSSNKYRASCGPGLASGWYCTLNAG